MGGISCHKYRSKLNISTVLRFRKLPNTTRLLEGTLEDQPPLLPRIRLITAQQPPLLVCIGGNLCDSPEDKQINGLVV